jgi:hypothetical protein
MLPLPRNRTCSVRLSFTAHSATGIVCHLPQLTSSTRSTLSVVVGLVVEVLLEVVLLVPEWVEVSVMVTKMEDCRLAINVEDQTISPEIAMQRVLNAMLAASLKDTSYVSFAYHLTASLETVHMQHKPQRMLQSAYRSPQSSHSLRISRCFGLAYPVASSQKWPI